MNPGDRVRLIDNPSRVGVLTSDAATGEGRRRRLVVAFPDGAEPILASSLERVEAETNDPVGSAQALPIGVAALPKRVLYESVC